MQFESCLNLQAFDLLKSKHFLKYSFTMKVGQSSNYNEYEERTYTFCSDFNKCRRNIILHSKDSFCVYSVLDNIKPFDCQNMSDITDGFYFVETENVLSFRGNGMYCKPLIQYGLQQRIIKMEDIKLKWKPSSTIKSGYFNKCIEEMLEAFASHNDAMKTGPNTLVGLFGRREHIFYKYQVCNNKNYDDIYGCSLPKIK